MAFQVDLSLPWSGMRLIERVDVVLHLADEVGFCLPDWQTSSVCSREGAFRRFFFVFWETDVVFCGALMGDGMVYSVFDGAGREGAIEDCAVHALAPDAARERGLWTGDAVSYHITSLTSRKRFGKFSSSSTKRRCSRPYIAGIAPRQPCRMPLRYHDTQNPIFSSGSVCVGESV